MSADDDLNTPLTPSEKRGDVRRQSWITLTAAALVTAGIGLFGWAILQNDPLGGQPHVVISLVETAGSPDPDQGPTGIRQTITPQDEAKTTPPAAAEAPNVTAIQRGGDLLFSERMAEAPNAEPDAPQTVIHGANRTAPVHLRSVPDRNLIEQTRFGALPKMGPRGLRASVTYARPSGLTATNRNDPQIAILVTGLGISASGTNEAIRTLPGAVTLAFAPYGNDLQRWIGKARRDGHEVMLQVPMEPFDYPDNDPGPHTLLTTIDSDENLKRLRWLMARFTGYTGITNYMGARFTGNQDAFAPVLKEIADRGLLYLDDGSSPRSLHERLAAGVSLPAGSADMVIDARQDAQHIDTALRQLEALAFQRGRAIGAATALPLSLERIARWTESLAEKGIVLVPVSATYIQPEQS